MAILKVRGPNAKGEYKVFMSKVVRDGKVQRAFADQIGHKAGACVRSGVHEGMSGVEIKDVVKKCGGASKGTKLSV